jgi:hypothetical protein
MELFDLMRYYESTINHMCRELEDFIIPSVSRAARRKAERMGIDSLREYHWDDQPLKTRMRDVGRKIFHWEHRKTVESLRKELCGLPKPSPQSVRRILQKARVAWVLKRDREN